VPHEVCFVGGVAPVLGACRGEARLTGYTLPLGNARLRLARSKPALWEELVASEQRSVYREICNLPNRHDFALTFIDGYC
jgi:hypothetical protein